jgi:hypothetical protein
MSIKYTPKESTGLLPPGIYLAKIIAASESYSMKGDQMIELDVLVGHQGEMKFLEKLYNTEKAAWKITQVRHSLGFEDKLGEAVSFEVDDLVHCAGIVEIALGKPRTEGKYVGKQFMEIARWMPRGTPLGVASEPAAESEVPANGIPF